MNDRGRSDTCGLTSFEIARIAKFDCVVCPALLEIGTIMLSSHALLSVIALFVTGSNAFQLPAAHAWPIISSRTRSLPAIMSDAVPPLEDEAAEEANAAPVNTSVEEPAKAVSIIRIFFRPKIIF